MKLNEFVDRLYAMGDIEQDNRNRKLNESISIRNSVINEDVNIDVKYDGRYSLPKIRRTVKKQLQYSGLPEEWVNRIVYYPTQNNTFIIEYKDGGSRDFDNTDLEEMSLDDAFREEFEAKYYDLIDDGIIDDNSLTEARNPENDEVNAVLRKWANSDRNRLSKKDQKVLDDAGISLKTDRYDAPHKYTVHKNNESDIIDLHRMDKHRIKSTHPDHDLANDLATTGRHWSNRDRYNKNKDPRFPWRDAEYRSETPEESDALRPYSDKYKSLKSAVDNSEGYPYLHRAAEQDLDDFRASIPKRKNESLNEAKTRTKANIHLVQNMFDEAVKNGLYDKAKKIVENRGIKVDKDKLYETPTSACTGAYIDLKKLLYK